MKPRNKFQQQVLEASNRLPKLTDAQVRWGYDNCIRHTGRRTAKGVITCTKCGHTWQGDGCPADLQSEHDRYVAKRQAMRERERIEMKREQALACEDAFRERKGMFFGIEFTDGTISVRVIESVEEVMTEGERMHHCVFANEYHLREDSLILSARIGGERLETIEFSLSRLTVVQSRGICNKETPYHRQIIDLVNKNANTIRKRLAA
jgi:hypothetical protein